MDHDRLFKELLTTFFFEFLDLFFPAMTQYLDRDHLEFLDKELFTDITSGQRHEADIVAKVRFRGQDAFFLVHIENQASSQAEFPRRMFRYFARLHEKHDLPVYPIALFSFDAPLRPEPSDYRVEFPDRLVLSFNFATVQLNRLHWRDYLRNPNPLASALMAKMTIDPQDRVHVKLECLRLLATFRLNPAKMQLIWGFVHSYLRVSRREELQIRQELESSVTQDSLTFIRSLPNEFVDDGMRRTLLVQFHRRFGQLPPSIEESLDDLARPDLEQLAQALFDFTSLDDLQRWLAAHPPTPGQ